MPLSHVIFSFRLFTILLPRVTSLSSVARLPIALVSFHSGSVISPLACISTFALAYSHFSSPPSLLPLLNPVFILSSLILILSLLSNLDPLPAPLPPPRPVASLLPFSGHVKVRLEGISGQGIGVSDRGSGLKGCG